MAILQNWYILSPKRERPCLYADMYLDKNYIKFVSFYNFGFIDITKIRIKDGEMQLGRMDAYFRNNKQRNEYQMEKLKIAIFDENYKDDNSSWDRVLGIYEIYKK